MKWLIVGAGYTGARLARAAQARGDEVVATRRSGDVVCDIAAPGDLPWRGRTLVMTMPPVGAEETFAGTAVAGGVSRILYVSSTGVYPPCDGRWIDEEEPARPESEHGKRRLQAEEDVRVHGAICLRAAGIYGPLRGVHRRLLAGTHSVIGAGDTYVNRIHVDDLVTALLCLADAKTLAHDVFNAADDEPTTQRDMADGVAKLLGVEPSPSIPPEEASPMARAFLASNRRIKNARLKSVGWKPKYPTWREGIAQALAEEASSS